MKKILLYSFGMLFFACMESPDPSQHSSRSNAHLERYDNFKSQYIGSRTVEVWLPNGYSDNETYAVLYMHDGQMLFDSTTTWNNQEWGVDETMSRLMEEGKIRNSIVVGIWNTNNRHGDFFPQKPFENLSLDYQDFLLNEALKPHGSRVFTGPIQSDNYLKFIVNELKPFIDISYSTKNDSDNTFIAGSSMGGLISLYALCEYPQIFSRAACLSTHWTGIYTDENNPIPAVIMDYLKENLPDPYSHKIYFDYGTQTLDTLYEHFQLQVDTIMQNAGYGSNYWVTKKFEGAGHSESAWNERLHIPLIFLLE